MTDTEVDPTATETDAEILRIRAKAIVDRAALMSAVGGAVPIPFVDFTAVVGAQVNMVRQLAHHYDRPFSQEIVRATIVGAGVGAAAAGGGRLLSRTLARAVPVVGLVEMWASSGVAAMGTLVVGRTYTHHFEKGGTAHDLDKDVLRQNYRSALKRRGGRQPKTA